MKYNININQKVVVDMGLDLDLSDLAILDYIKDLTNYSKVVKQEFDGETYFWVQYEHLIKEMPLLQIKNKEVAKRKLDKLVSAGFLEKKVFKRNSTYFKFGPNYDSYIFGKGDSEKETMGFDGKVEGFDGKVEGFDGKVEGGSTKKSKGVRLKSRSKNNNIINHSHYKYTANEKKFFEDSQLNEKMKEFIIHRKELKDPMTDRGITLLTNKINSYLTEYTKEQVLDFFDEAIINSRKSVFPTKNFNNKNRATGQSEKSKPNTYTVDNFTDRLNFTDINNEELTLKEIKTNFNFPTYNEDYLKTMIRIIKHIGIDKAKEEYREVSKTTFNGIAPLDWLEDYLYSKYINEVNNNN